MISDIGEAPLSSTRRSSFFNLSNINGRPSFKRIPLNRLSGPSILSSTRMSEVGHPETMLVLNEDAACTDEVCFTTKASKADAAANGMRFPPCQSDYPALFSRHKDRKSVSFKVTDEYFPVFSPEAPKQDPACEARQCTSSSHFDVSDYSDFLDSERMATVFPQQGIDVTSPDHVYVFFRESSESTEEDLEKTVIGHFASEANDDEQELQNVKELQGNAPEQQAQSHAGSNSSGSGSHYSSCESDHYTSALEPSALLGHNLKPVVDDVSTGAISEKKSQVSGDSDNEFTRQEYNLPSLQAESKRGSKPETIEPLPSMFDKLTLSKENKLNNVAVEVCSSPDIKDVARPLSYSRSDAVEALEENDNLPFTPSPFVTSRTRSRLSRCSLRTSKTPESLLITSSLFEDTLPTPVRTFRQTPRSQSSELCYNSPHVHCNTPLYSGKSEYGQTLALDSQDTQSSTLTAASTVSNSQADTLILSKTLNEPADELHSLCDTVLIDKSQNSSVDAYERNFAEIVLAVRGQNRDLSEGGEFLTDDLSSADEAITKKNVNDASAEHQVNNLKSEEVWITEDCSSQSDHASSSSTSSCFSPRTSREDSDLTGTPGTGFTPRYSMSRLSSSCRPQRLAELSYTPGGRPLIQDMDEPVEYLYTDTEQGHKLIETHVPPTSDTSFSSGLSTTSSEETILYDWQSLQSEMKSNKGKEKRQLQTVVQEKENGNSDNSLLPETRGITDKELRLRLVELGENPGPISNRTRPTYMRRLCRLLKESNSLSQHPQRQLDQPQTGNADY